MGWWAKLKSVFRSIVGMEERLHQLGAVAARVEERVGALADLTGTIAALMAREQMLAILASPRYQDSLRLERHGFKVLSQFDEDGVIAEIFRRIGVVSRTCIEFGAGDGHENCSAFLIMQGWRGLWIDGSQSNVAQMARTWPDQFASGQLTTRCAFITVDTIDEIITTAGFSGEIDFLSVDIDGNDYHVLERISSVTPRVVCVESNANFPPDVVWTMARNDSHVWDKFDFRTGASLKALEIMMRTKGYELVGTSFAGVNAFFVRADLVEGKFAEPFTAENHYNPFRFFYPTKHLASSNWRGTLT